jgi:ABC-type lipoprotein release transport system permease subunit
MKLSFRIAFRYLFAKKSHHAINIISAISAAGVVVGTMAIIAVLSVFNGFEHLIEHLFSAFDPEIKIEAVEGKSFNDQTAAWQQVRHLPGIAYFDEVVQDNAMLRYKERQMPATIKGVGNAFQKMTRIDSLMTDGSFVLWDGAFQNGVMGVGLASALGTVAKALDPVMIYVPKRTGQINLINPESSFNQAVVFVSGTFSVKQPEYDDHYFIVSLDLARRLFSYNDSTVTAVEMNLTPSASVDKIQGEIKKILGPSYRVLNRFEQQGDYFRIMKIEKWITYLILSFILLIAVFNIVGSLTMLIIDKQDDIQMLRHLGADNTLIQHIFLFEGWFISIIGGLVGVVLGTLLSYGQEYYGWIKLQGSDFIIQSYPVFVQWSDILLVLATVLLMGFLAALYPVYYLKKEFLND